MPYSRAIILHLFAIPVIIAFFTPCASFSAQGVKTSLKRYSLFTYDNKAYLCEPYQVKQDEWLYKIFRRKGEISASDFPLFLKIFKAINPKVSNIDSIAPGRRVLIPLKEVDKNEYQQNRNGTVEMPVLEFSTKVKPNTLTQHTHTHEVKAGDTMSELLSKDFLNTSGDVSKIGEQTILQLNPGIENINLVYQGMSVLIPESSILSQPWFKDFLTLKKQVAPSVETIAPTDITTAKPTAPHEPQLVSKADLAYLKRYTQLIRGHLMHQGQLFFPSVGQTGKPQSIDLSKTPVISDGSGKKTILLGPDATENAMTPDLVAAMKTYWKDLQFKKFSELLTAAVQFNTKTMKDVPGSQASLLKTLLAEIPYSYESQVPLSVALSNVKLTVSLDRIIQDQSPGILINPGSVYGKALDALKTQGYRILDLPLDLSFEDICIRLFSQLGYQVYKNPSFNTGWKVENIPGVFVEKKMEKLFFTRTPLFRSPITFLYNEKVDVILLDKEPAQ